MTKLPKSELQNARIIRLAIQFFSLPFVFVRALFEWARAGLLGMRSPQRVRVADQLRQSRARRTLRGLPPDHGR
jgi:hypothetical protein